ncbi:thioredoxin fold domain-containing protein [Acidiferrobacter sp.]|uniref:thioredoxin fold domain-containing protein n=1 Tax=Acidiferrobacter sp. TaxID=1872107 RepID=UPI00262B2E0D|nr:thioredoxin fold domain-containing protein [Acidiferrobacter sp.]
MGGIMAAVLAFLLATGIAQGRLVNRGVWPYVRQCASIREGRGPVRLYVFFDPNCPYCHSLYDALQPAIRQRGLVVRWVPVGILTLSSYGKAAALLRATHKAAAMARMEAGFRNGRGAIRPRRAPPPVARRLSYNVQLFEDIGARGVPFLIYKTRKDHVHAVTGDPPRSDLARIEARIAGRPKATPQTARP